VDVLKFGYGGDAYWREVFGCQRSFDAHDKFQPTRRLEWNKPLVWTCNADMDPRREPVVAQYLREVNTVVVVLKQPLYSPGCVSEPGGTGGLTPVEEGAKRRRRSDGWEGGA
jgi:hypothetical protein